MIQIENVTVRLGQQLVLDRFSFVLPETGRIALMGPSGCGKSTLLRAMAKLVPYEGSISGLEDRTIGLLFQDDRLLPQLTALHNAAAALPDSMPKKQRLERAGQLLLGCGLPEDALGKRPSELSGGMKKRVSIARLLAFEADVWLLDEPFSGLDDKSREEVMGLLLSLIGDKLMVLVTHDRYEAESFAGRIVRLFGPPLAVASKPHELVWDDV
jgi:ABC-type nitrate/sulfonate/bicarbonate transport system ATPase subunit